MNLAEASEAIASLESREKTSEARLGKLEVIVTDGNGRPSLLERVGVHDRQMVNIQDALDALNRNVETILADLAERKDRDKDERGAWGVIGLLAGGSVTVLLEVLVRHLF
jgi:hypothetical protein